MAISPEGCCCFPQRAPAEDGTVKRLYAEDVGELALADRHRERLQLRGGGRDGSASGVIA